METIFKNFKYSVQQDELGIQKYTVTSKPAPATLFKFYSLLEHNVNALKNHQFWASEPEDFNDLFDSKAFLIDFSRLDLQTAKKLVDTPAQKKEMDRLYRQDTDKFILEAQKSHYSIIFSKLGIVSMTSNYNNEILWALYAQNSGFCIELDYAMFPDNFQGPFPINYVDQLELIDIMKYGGHLSFLIQVTQKKKKWKFEDEYRFIIASGTNPFKLSNSIYTKHTSQDGAIPRLVNYPKQAIKSIYLGFTFIKGECVHDKKVCLISKYRDLKATLLDEIIDRDYNCYLIDKEPDSLSLEKSNFKIVKLDCYKYLFSEIPISSHLSASML